MLIPTDDVGRAIVQSVLPAAVANGQRVRITRCAVWRANWQVVIEPRHDVTDPTRACFYVLYLCRA